jgi:Fur family transcriptional regulator, ferric uptake regulator
MESNQKKTRITKQRQVILEEIRAVYSHPTADEVHALVRKKLPRISLGTIYRNLEFMAAQNQILRLDWAGSPRRYDGNTADHFHLRCVRCGRVQDLLLDYPRGLEKKVAAETDYELLGCRLEFVGHCPRCKTTKQRGH